MSKPGSICRDERRRAEAAFAKALLQKKHVLVMFYSRRCQLCSRLRKPLAAVQEEHKAWLEVARLCADDEQTWALEVSYMSKTFTACALTLTCKAYVFRLRWQLLHYNIDYVPSFVLLNPPGAPLPAFATAGTLACELSASAEADMSCR